MSTRYLLSCPCGATLEVDATHAGRSLKCSCGKPVEVPGLRGLRQLERVPESKKPKPKSAWSPIKGILFAVGLLVAAVAGVALAWSVFERSRMLAVESPQQDVRLEADLSQIERLAPDEAWEAWIKIRDVDTLVPRVTPPHILAQRRAAEILRTIRVEVAFIASGSVLLLIGLFWPAARRP